MTKTITPPPKDEPNETVKAPPPPTVTDGAGIAAALREEVERLRAERDEARRWAEDLHDEPWHLPWLDKKGNHPK